MTELLRTGFYRLVEGRHGRFLANPRDIYIGRSLIEYGEFSEAEWQVLDQLIRPGAVVIEAGANIGAFTVPLAKKVGTGGLVYAFEPQITVFQQLCANLALNDLVNVQAWNAGCGAESAWMRLNRINPGAETNFGGLSLTHLAGDSPVKVRIERLDEAVDPPRLDLIKADVEGMEAQVLTGARGLIDRFRPWLYVEAHDPADAPALIELLLGMDYAPYWHLPPMFSPQNHFGKAENLFGRITSKNILGVPAEAGQTVTGLRPVAGPEDHPRHWTA